jgi:hypothetical protein
MWMVVGYLELKAFFWWFQYKLLLSQSLGERPDIFDHWVITWLYDYPRRTHTLDADILGVSNHIPQL